MIDIEIRSYGGDQFEGVKALWQEAFPSDPPWNAAELAIPAKLAVQPELFLVAVRRDEVVGSIMAGYDGHRGWLYAVAVSNAYNRRGIGTALVREAEKRLRAMGCHKVNLQVRTSNAVVIAFYERLGYITEDRISMGKRLAESSGNGA
jgi:ribosomal protein S18 acetylase RimI-like enzyme